MRISPQKTNLTSISINCINRLILVLNLNLTKWLETIHILHNRREYKKLRHWH